MTPIKGFHVLSQTNCLGVQWG